MGWIDIVFFVVVGITAVIGLSKGLFESILSIFSSVISIVIAFLLGKHLATFINKIVDADGFFEKTFNLSDSFLGQTPSQIASAFTLLFCVIGIWIIIKLAIFLLSKLFESATTSNSAASGLNRLLGLLFGAAKGLFYTGVALAFAAILNIAGFTGVQQYIKDNSTVTSFVYGFVEDWVNDSVMDRLNILLGNDDDTATEDSQVEDNTQSEDNNNESTDSNSNETTVTDSE